MDKPSLLSLYSTNEKLKRATRKKREEEDEEIKYTTKPFPQWKLSLPIVGQDFTFYMDVMFLTNFTTEGGEETPRKTKGIDIKQADDLHPNYIGFAPDYTCALVIIEGTTRRAWAFPLHTKNAKEILLAFKLFLADIDMKISKLISDSGSEYSEIKKYNNQRKLFHYFQVNASQNMHTTLSRVDRFIRTLREILKGYYNMASNPDWVSVLKLIVDRYNRTFHSSLFLKDPKKGNKKIFYTPEQVWRNPELRRRIKIKDYMAKYKNYRILDRDFKEGTVVRYRVLPGQMKYGKSSGFLSLHTAIIRKRIGNSFKIQLKSRFDKKENEFTGTQIIVPARDLCLESKISSPTPQSKYNIYNLLHNEEIKPTKPSLPSPSPPPPPSTSSPQQKYKTRSGRIIKQNKYSDYFYDN